MQRFEKYIDSYNYLDLLKISDAEILAVTDKKFILDITILDELYKFEYEEEPDPYDDNICEETIELFRDKYKTIFDVTPDPQVEGNNIHDDTLSWFIYCKTRPLVAQEVIKIKEFYNSIEYCNPIKNIELIDLVD